MATRKKLVRLCHLREIEEEQSRLELERAVVVRNRLERDLGQTSELELRMKQEFVDFVSVDDRPGRTGATLAVGLAGRQRLNLAKYLSEWDLTVAALRNDYLRRRTGRLQIESLIGAMKRKEETEAAHRAQQMLDDWFGRRSPKVAKGTDHADNATPV